MVRSNGNRRLRRYQAWGVAAFLCAGVVHAQTTTPAAAQATELQSVLKKLGAAAVELEKSLPSFTCEESVVSQELRDGKVRRSVTFTATLRAQREAAGRLAESFQIITLNGKPFTDGTVKAPVMVSGGFDAAMRYFHPEQRQCYDFLLSPGRIDFKGAPEGTVHGCKETGIAGFARLDAEGHASYLERTVPPETTKRLKMASYAAVTFAPVTMGDKTYRLSRHMIAERPMGKSTGRFEATYTNCRLFKATATILPGATLPDDSSASKP